MHRPSIEAVLKCSDVWPEPSVSVATLHPLPHSAVQNKQGSSWMLSSPAGISRAPQAAAVLRPQADTVSVHREKAEQLQIPAPVPSDAHRKQASKPAGEHPDRVSGPWLVKVKVKAATRQTRPFMYIEFYLNEFGGGN